MRTPFNQGALTRKRFLPSLLDYVCAVEGDTVCVNPLVAVERGPLVYRAEAADNGGSVLGLALPDDAPIGVERRAGLLGGISVLRTTTAATDGPRHPLVAVPYHVWACRGPGDIGVWLDRAAAKKGR